MQLDYGLISGLEEWVGGTYKITNDFYRLIIYTEEAQKILWHIFGKMVPLGAHIKLAKEDIIAIHLVLANKNNALCGIYGPCHIEEEPDNEYDWTDL